jgi:hypothetical protein
MKKILEGEELKEQDPALRKKKATYLARTTSDPATYTASINDVIGQAKNACIMSNAMEKALKKEINITNDTTMAQLYKLETSLLDFKAITKTKMTGHWMPSALTFVLALMVCGMFLALFLIPPSEAYGQVLIMIAGTVSGAFSTAVAFWLGSSQGSWEKQKTLTNK